MIPEGDHISQAIVIKLENQTFIRSNVPTGYSAGMGGIFCKSSIGLGSGCCGCIRRSGQVFSFLERVAVTRDILLVMLDFISG